MFSFSFLGTASEVQESKHLEDHENYNITGTNNPMVPTSIFYPVSDHFITITIPNHNYTASCSSPQSTYYIGI